MEIILLILLILIVLAIITEFLLKNYSNKIWKNKIEFPFTNPELLKKFKNFDIELGWEPKPVEEAIDTGHHRSRSFKSKNIKPKYSINPDGSRYQPDSGNSLNGQLIEFFGDSATFCRDVEDNETYEYYLEKDYGLGPCKNFGVGSYGIDQSYLRAQRRMSGNGIAVLYMPLLSLYRTGAYYKHYATPGNTWALKPRFKIRNGELKLIHTPIKKREELSDLSQNAQIIRKHDNHYKDFKNYLLPNNGSYLIYLIKNRHALPELIKKLKNKTNNRLLIQSIKIIDNSLDKFTNKLTYKKYMRSGKKLIEYSEGEEGLLFANIVKKFCELSKSRGSNPFVFVSPQGYPMNFPKEYNHAAKKLKLLCNEHEIILHDLGEDYFSLDDHLQSKFNVHKTHPSPEGNKFIAEWLNNKFQEYNYLK